jgi:GT2 family glycosyltransferase
VSGRGGLGRGHRQPAVAPAISVVVPTHEGSASWLGACLRGLVEQDGAPIPEVLVVLDGPAPGAEAVVRDALPAARLVRRSQSGGFAVAANAGIRAATGGLVALLNDDAIPEPGWLVAMLDAAERHPDVGSFASRVLRLHAPATIDSAGHGLTRWGEPFAIGAGCADGPVYDVGRPVFGAPAAAAVYRCELLRELRGFDEAMEAYLEDVDLSLRARVLGFGCRYVPEARVLHRGSASYGWGVGDGRAERLIARNRLRLLLRSMPRNPLRAGAPAAVGSIAADLVQRTLRGRHARAALAGTLEGLREMRGSLAGRGAALGGRRADDAELRQALRDSEDRLAELADAPDAGPWRRARLALAIALADRVDRAEERQALAGW